MIELQTLGRLRLLGTRPDGDASPAPVQPKRLALLAYLAVESARGPVRRDLLLALFWPELGHEEARRALRQALHHLRRLLGEDVLVGTGEELSVNGERIRCDSVELERFVAVGQPEQALTLYGGDFLAGFHVTDVAPELEEWVDRTRGRLRRQAAAAAWAAADDFHGAADVNRVIELARRGCELEPDQEGGWRRLMLLQERLGDRAGALRTYDELAARLQREFDAAPSAETAAVAGRLRAARPPGEAPADAPGRNTGGRRPWLASAGAAVLLALGAVVAAIRTSAAAPEEPSLLAAGVIAPRDRLLIADFTDTNGDTALAVGRAAETRLRLLALWRRADAPLQPVLAEVRTRIPVAAP